MWIATLLRAEKMHGRLVLEVAYSDDGAEPIIERDNLVGATRKSVRDHVRRQVAKFEALKNENIDLPIGQTIDIDPDVVIPPTPPTAEEIARRDWFLRWNRMQRFVRLVDAGLLQADDTRITNLRTSLQADWDNSYMDGV